MNRATLARLRTDLERLAPHRPPAQPPSVRDYARRFLNRLTDVAHASIRRRESDRHLATLVGEAWVLLRAAAAADDDDTLPRLRAVLEAVDWGARLDWDSRHGDYVRGHGVTWRNRAEQRALLAATGLYDPERFDVALYELALTHCPDLVSELESYE